ncbi:LicD family protein [Patescibacteria group bacterium]|nr:LicD family protein [Patescibacteria group bacterium]
METQLTKEEIVTGHRPLVSLDKAATGNVVNLLQALKELKSLFDSAKINYWLNMGTLLGAVRSNEFIDGDGDIDLGVVVDEMPKILPLLSELGKKGWRVDVTTFSLFLLRLESNVLIEVIIYQRQEDKLWTPLLKIPPRFNSFLKYTDLIAERAIYRSYHQNIPRRHALAYALIPSWLDRPIRKLLFSINDLCGQKHYAMSFPVELLNNLQVVKLYDQEFLSPSPAETYLTLIYGPTWRVPNPNWKTENTVAINKGLFKTSDQANYVLIK